MPDAAPHATPHTAPGALDAPATQAPAPLAPAYERVFAELALSRYRVHAVADFVVDGGGRADPDVVNVVLRVDVDPGGLQFAAPLARHLRGLELDASLYFLTETARHYDVWDSGVPAAVAGAGMEVGVHSDHLYTQVQGGGDGLARLREDIQGMGRIAGQRVRGVVGHGHPGIDAMGRASRDLYDAVPPQDLGVDYHDGGCGGYVRETMDGPVPPCDVWLIDYLGPGGGGWTVWPGLPLRRLRRARRGEVVHMVVHPLNAYQWWRGWDGRYGEVPPRRPGYLGRMARALRARVRHGLLRGRGAPYMLAVAGIEVAAWTLAKGVGLVWPRGDRTERDTSWAAGRETIFAKGLGYWRARLERLGLTSPGARVLEVGSGDGQWLLAFAQDAAEVVGIEPNRIFRETSVQTIAQHPDRAQRITVQDGVAERLAFADASFDRVLCAGVLMFTRQDKALAEMARVLRPGGLVCVTVNGLGWFVMYCLDGLRHRSVQKMRYGLQGIVGTLARWWFGRDTRFARAVRADEMRAMLADCGLRLVDVRYFQGIRQNPDEHLGWPTNYAFVAQKPVEDA